MEAKCVGGISRRADDLASEGTVLSEARGSLVSNCIHICVCNYTVSVNTWQVHWSDIRYPSPEMMWRESIAHKAIKGMLLFCRAPVSAFMYEEMCANRPRPCLHRSVLIYLTCSAHSGRGLSTQMISFLQSGRKGRNGEKCCKDRQKKWDSGG